MANYLQTSISLPKYVPKYDLDTSAKISLAMEAQYEQGIDKIQGSIDQMSKLPIVNLADQQYLNDKLNSVTEQINQKAGVMNFRDKSDVRALTTLANSVSNDYRILNAVESSLIYQNDILLSEEDSKNNPYPNDANRWWMKTQQQKYKYSTDSKAVYTSSYNKAYDHIKNLNDLLHKTKGLENVSATYSSAGMGAVNLNTVSDPILRQKAQNIISDYYNNNIAARRQLGIETSMKYQNYTDEDFNKEVGKKIEQQKNKYQIAINGFDAVLNQSNLDENTLQYFQTQKKIAEDQLSLFNQESEKYINSLTSSKTDKAFWLGLSSITDMFQNLYGYTKESNKLEVDPVFKAQIDLQNANNATRQIDAEIADKAADNAREDAKAQFERAKTMYEIQYGKIGKASSSKDSDGDGIPDMTVSGQIYSTATQTTITPEENYDNAVSSYNSLSNATENTRMQMIWSASNGEGLNGVLESDPTNLGVKRGANYDETAMNNLEQVILKKFFSGQIVDEQQAQDVLTYLQNKYLLDSQKGVFDKINKEAPQIQELQNKVIKTKTQYINTVNNLISLNTNFSNELKAEGLSPENLYNVQKIYQKIPNLSSLGLNMTKALSSIGSGWSQLLNPQGKLDKNNSFYKEAALAISKATGVTDPAALQYYIKSSITGSILNSKTGEIWRNITGASKGQRLFRGGAGYATSLNSFDLNTDNEQLKKYKAQIFTKYGLVKQSRYFQIDFDPKTKNEVLGGMLSTAYDAIVSMPGIAEGQDAKDLSKFKEMYESVRTSSEGFKGVNMAYNPIDIEKGLATYSFNWTSGSGSNATSEHVEVKLPISIINNSISQIQTTIFPQERILLRNMQILGNNNSTIPQGAKTNAEMGASSIPIASGYNTVVGYHVKYNNGKYTPIVYLKMKDPDGMRRWHKLTILGNDGQDYKTSALGDLLTAMHTFKIQDWINVYNKNLSLGTVSQQELLTPQQSTNASTNTQ